MVMAGGSWWQLVAGGSYKIGYSFVMPSAQVFSCSRSCALIRCSPRVAPSLLPERHLQSGTGELIYAPLAPNSDHGCLRCRSSVIVRGRNGRLR